MAPRAMRYLREYVKDRDVGALYPSSRFLVRRIIRCLDRPRIKTLVELGPGPGIATRPILDALREDARYIAIEKNPAFLTALRTSTPDPRLQAVEGDALDLGTILSSRGVVSADAVIASIPFSFLTAEERARLVAGVHSILTEGGDFIVFHQFSPLMRSCLRERFFRVKVHFEPRNIFPCFLLHCKKGS